MTPTEEEVRRYARAALLVANEIEEGDLLERVGRGAFYGPDGSPCCSIGHIESRAPDIRPRSSVHREINAVISANDSLLTIGRGPRIVKAIRQLVTALLRAYGVKL